MKKYYFLPLLIAFVLQANAQVNFSEHIAPIIYENCTTCHRPGEIGPMPLTNYDEVKNWASMIQYVTEINYMPPWKADTEFSNFIGERTLTDDQKQMITDWVTAGSPQGDPSLEPQLPDFPTGSQVGVPDLVLSFAENFEHYGGNQDEYRNFVLPTGLTENKDVDAIEIRPGNAAIVHHALFTYDVSGQARILDAQDSKYGYDGFGGFGVDAVFDKQFPAYTPGQKPRRYPQQMGQLLPAGADLLVQMHYAPTPFPEYDSSTINIFFKDEPVERYVQNYVMLPFGNVLTNGPFVIPPNGTKTFHGVYRAPTDISLVSIFPHMHLLGKDWKVYAVSPNKADTINLVSIDDWDFNWQGNYNFKKFMVVKRNWEIHAYATYDNTASNPLNPNNPPAWMGWGENTTDEMFYLAVAYVNYQDGDENVVLEDVTTSTEDGPELVYPETKLYPIYPNPTDGNIRIGYQLASSGYTTLNLMDSQGKLIRKLIDNQFIALGNHSIDVNMNEFPQGIYYVNLNGKDFNITEGVSLIKRN